LILIPFVNLIFLFIPGTDGENRFGKQPPPNRGVGIWIAILLVGIFLIGVLAAIAIPAYQSYVKKAQAAALSAAPAPTAQQ
jgi:flagellar basal body-associated protein FliL